MNPADQIKGVPLSFAQQRLWFLYQLNPQSSEYNISRAWRITGPLNTQVLQASLNAVVIRHEALRTTFQDIDGKPIQTIQPTLTVPFQKKDWSAYSPEQLDAKIERFLLNEPLQPFNLFTGPLLRFTLLSGRPNEHIFVFTVHHMVFDGTSLKIFCQELSSCYTSTLANQPTSLIPLPIQYQHYVSWQHNQISNEKLNSQLTYWKHQLQGAPLVLELPSQGDRPKTHSGLQKYHTFTVAPQVISKLKVLIRPQGITLFMALLAVFKILLTRYTGQRDILVGTPIAGRAHPDLEKLIGFLVNILVLRTQIVDQLSFQDVLRQIRKTSLEAYRNQDLPFEKLVETLNPVRDANRAPVVQAIFQFRQQADRCLSLPNLTAHPFPDAIQPGNFDLYMVCEESEFGIEGFVYYSPALYSDDFIAAFSKHYQILLEKLIANPDTPVTQLSFLTDAERHQQLVEWNNSATPYPTEFCIHQLFEEQVARTPEAIAGIHKTGQLTFTQMNARANQLAHYLQRQGVGPETRVALFLERSLDLVISLLGILKAGGSYVPLDPNYPAERIAYLLTDAQPALLLTQENFLQNLPLYDGTIVYLETTRSDIEREPHTSPNCLASPDNLAYIIYTSGSTGRPKGIQVTHRNVGNLVQWHQGAFELSQHDRTTHLAGLAFDATVWEIWPTLLAGGCLVLPKSEDLRLSPDRLQDWLIRENITISFLPTPLAESILPVPWPATVPLRIMQTGGDVLHHYPPTGLPFTFVNNYGPTENTVVTTSGIVTPISNKRNQPPPIGQPIANTQIFVIDPFTQLVPTGVYGELLIGGDGLSRGYLNQPALTAEKFHPHPFSEVPGARVYRTGDQVRWTYSGVLEYLGRKDGQIKIRGYRIEVGEIEAVLGEHPSVSKAVISCREDRPGEKELVAYIVGKISPSELRHYLQNRLPTYMVPSAFVLVEALPFTPNGKIDRQALPAPTVENRIQSRAYEKPRTPTEEILVAIWQEVLGLEQVGIHDNFFELGGHSLVATQVISRMRKQLQLDVTFLTFFQFPTIAGVADALSSNVPLKSKPSILPRPFGARTNSLPLSFAQERFWFLEQVEESEGVFCIPVLLRLQGDLNITALEISFHRLIRRHEILRTTFHNRGDVPVQVIVSDRDYSLSIINIKGQTAHDRFNAVSQLVEQYVLQPFDLRHGPLMKTTLFRGLETEFFLLITFHHIISDGWSVGIFTEELIAAYEAYSKGREPNFSSLPIQYADYTLWQHDWAQGEKLDRLLNYWRHQLAGAPTALSLPTDHSRMIAKTFRAASKRIHLPGSLTSQLKALAQKKRGNTLHGAARNF